jgi:hypothetical protein
MVIRACGSGSLIDSGTTSQPGFSGQALIEFSRMSHETFLSYLRDIKSCPPPTNYFSPYQVQLITAERKKHAAWNRAVFALCPLVSHQKDDAQLISEKALNIFCRWIAQSDLLLWDYRDTGCFARADFISRFLYESGLPFDSISKFYILSADGKLNPPLNQWYHVAVSVISKDLREWIVDPLIDPQQAILFPEWLSRQGVDAQFICNFMQSDRSTRICFYPSNEWPLKHDSNQKFCLIKLPINTTLAGPGEEGLYFTVDDILKIKQNAIRISQYSLRIELGELSQLLSSRVRPIKRDESFLTKQ